MKQYDEQDGSPRGLPIDRRALLALFGRLIVAAGATVSAQAVNATVLNAKMPACVVTPQQTEGPYFVDEHLLRSDIRSDPATGRVSAGAPLTLTLRILSVSNARCLPLAGAVVDIWHCDAAGVYSDVVDPGFKTVGKKFLRGYQITNQDGVVRFVTIYPGWYPGRAIHLHFKIRSVSQARQMVEFTSQLYFDDAISDQVLTHPEYARHPGHRLRNQQDQIFRDGGRLLTLVPRKEGAGYVAAFDVGLALA